MTLDGYSAASLRDRLCAAAGEVNPTTAWRGIYPPETNLGNNGSGNYVVSFESAPKLDTIVYLASEASGYMAGQSLTLDGGFLSW